MMVVWHGREWAARRWPARPIVASLLAQFMTSYEGIAFRHVSRTWLLPAMNGAIRHGGELAHAGLGDQCDHWRARQQVFDSVLAAGVRLRARQLGPPRGARGTGATRHGAHRPRCGRTGSQRRDHPDANHHTG